MIVISCARGGEIDYVHVDLCFTSDWYNKCVYE